jgi:pimeloyl-ACP methyl ester carboxylesterase
MVRLAAHYREAGSGPTVICIHSSASSSAQWRALMERISARYHVVAVDLYGYGQSPSWPDDCELSLDDEIALLEPIFQLAGEFHLVGHSYGGAIAMKAVLADQARVLSLTLYEPAYWGILEANAPDDTATQEVQALRDETTRLIESGELESAACRFVDYWVGPDTWSSMPDSTRSAITSTIPKVRLEWKASFDARISLSACKKIDVPTLFLTGSRSPPPARVLSNLLRSALRCRNEVEFPDLGHMGPVTHPHRVNESIASFLKGYGK